jgi:hypothetical protein
MLPVSGFHTMFCLFKRSLTTRRAVAWSKTGTIATLTPDRQGIELRFLRCNPKDGSWDLSEPTPCSLVQGSPSIPLVHLEWGVTNTPELAVIDAAGRVAVVTCSVALNNLYLTRKWDNDSIDDMHAVVGCHWLAAAPSNQQVNIHITMSLVTFVHATGACSHLGRNHTMSCTAQRVRMETHGSMKALLCMLGVQIIHKAPRAPFFASP